MQSYALLPSTLLIISTETFNSAATLKMDHPKSASTDESATSLKQAWPLNIHGFELLMPNWFECFDERHSRPQLYIPATIPALHDV